jgi:hypothetical protein
MAQAAGNVDTAHSAQADIQYHHVGPQPPGQSQGLFAVPGLGHDLDVRRRLQQGPCALAQQHVVVDQHHADHLAPPTPGLRGIQPVRPFPGRAPR